MPPSRRRRQPPPSDDVVDRAAAVAARNTVTEISLRHAAYAAALAREGLLRHFPDEADLLADVTRISRRAVTDLVARATALAPGRERDRVVVEGVVDFVIERPGIAALGRSRAAAQEADPEAERRGRALLGALGVDPETEPERLLTAVSALAGLDAATHLAVEGEPPAGWRDTVVATALRTLGHPAVSAAHGVHDVA